jgi:hypothetical protein
MDLRNRSDRSLTVGLNAPTQAPASKHSAERLEAPHPRLTTSEWRAVAAAFEIASTHACGGVRNGLPPTSGLRRFLRAFTGSRTPQAVAEPRLEKLRAFLCFAKENGQPSQAIGEELVALGFSKAQVEALALLALDGTQRPE